MRTVAVGALLGLTWAASLRGWMLDLAGADSRFTWIGTFACLLLPGAIVGGLLGRALDLQRAGVQPRWLVFSPLIFGLSPLAIPGAVGHLFRTGEGTSSMIMVLLAMLAGRSMSGRGRVATRIIAGLVGFALVPILLLMAQTPREAWAATLFATLFIVLALACALVMRHVSPTVEPRAGTRIGMINRPVEKTPAGRPR